MMKLELKTENKIYPKSIWYFFGLISSLTIVIILINALFKLGIISKHYEIDYNCRLLAIAKSTIIFKKLSTLSNLKSKQRIWEFCRGVIK